MSFGLDVWLEMNILEIGLAYCVTSTALPRLKTGERDDYTDEQRYQLVDKINRHRREMAKDIGIANMNRVVSVANTKTKKKIF